jgi:hypothetical protein
MQRALVTLIALGAVGDAAATECTYTGSVPMYVGCIADLAAQANDSNTYVWQHNGAVETRVARSAPYHVSITADGPYKNSTFPIPLEVVDELCGDADGCRFRLGMTKWGSDAETAAANREGLLYYSPTDGVWRASTDASGVSGNGSTQHIMDAGGWGTCYLTDGVYSDHVMLGDTDRGLHLLLWDGYDFERRGCHLTLED